MGSKGKKGDICLDEGEEGIGNEEESAEHLPRIYFTFSVKTIKREPPINRASPRDYECLHLQKRKKKKREKKFPRNERRRNLEIRDTTKFFANSKYRTKSFVEFSRDFERRSVYSKSSTIPRACFTRTHFGIDAGSKGMVQCLRSAGGRMEGRVYRGMPLVGLSCKPFPRAKPTSPTLYSVPFPPRHL